MKGRNIINSKGMINKIKSGLKNGYSYVVLGGLAALLSPSLAGAQTVVTWSTSDTDDVVAPGYTAWKTYLKWFLIVGIPILIALYFLGRVLGIFQGRR